MEHLEFFYADGINKLFPEQSLVITPLPIDYIFSNFAANQEVKSCSQDIKNITWLAKFNQEVLNLHNFYQDNLAPEHVYLEDTHKLASLPELNIFVLDLAQEYIPQALINLLDSNLDKYLLFICHYEGRYSLSANLKFNFTPSATQKSSQFPFEITSSLNSQWLSANKLLDTFSLQGKTVKDLYLNLLSLIYLNSSKHSQKQDAHTQAPQQHAAQKHPNQADKAPLPYDHSKVNPITLNLPKILELENQLTKLIQEGDRLNKAKNKERQPNKKFALHTNFQTVQKKILATKEQLQQLKDSAN